MTPHEMKNTAETVNPSRRYSYVWDLSPLQLNPYGAG